MGTDDPVAAARAAGLDEETLEGVLRGNAARLLAGTRTEVG
jgi:hypothetical protein